MADQTTTNEAAATADIDALKSTWHWLKRASEGDDWAAALRWASQMEWHARSVTREMVRVARDREMTWEEIGEALGVTRQSAHERFAHLMT